MLEGKGGQMSVGHHGSFDAGAKEQTTKDRPMLLSCLQEDGRWLCEPIVHNLDRLFYGIWILEDLRMRSYTQKPQYRSPGKPYRLRTIQCFHEPAGDRLLDGLDGP